jgi:hypothetical protein
MFAGAVCWNFDTEAPASNGVPNVTAGAVSRGNGGTSSLLTGSSASGGYAGASGGSNAVAYATGGPLNTNVSAYFQFTLTPGAGSVLNLTKLSFGVRSTATGPQAFSVRSSLDCYGSDLAGGEVVPDSNWALKSVAPLSQSSAAGDSVTFRIYGYNGTEKVQNWRIDDLVLEVFAVVQFPSGSVISLK